MKKIITLGLLLISVNFYGQTNFEQNPVINLINGDYNPSSAVILDIDGDNKADIITTGGSKLMWYKNIDGQGSFSIGKPIVDASAFKKLYVADMDSDGNLDIIYTRQQGVIEINYVKNNGDGTFEAPVVLVANSAAQKCQLVDLDGDNNLDIVYYDNSYSAIRWLKNDGQGNFTAITPSLVNNITNFYITDFSGDGRGDMVVTTTTGLKAYLNNGDTTFSLTETLDNTTSGTFITGADIDGDNDNDIVFLYSSGTTKKIYWYQNNSGVFDNAATLVNNITVTTPITNDNIILLMADVDADGKVDILCGTPHMGRLAWYKNLGNAVFGPEQVITTLAKGISDITIGDINGDGQKDVVATAFDAHKIAWYKNTGTSFTDEAVISNNAIYPHAAAGDMDGDGDIDLVSVSTSDSKVAWYKNTNGQGDFTAEKQIIISNTTIFPQNLQIVDVDNDGDLDIAIDTGDPGLPNTHAFMFFKNNGMGSFTKETVFEGFSLNSYLFDIDSDGDLDILTGPSGMKIRKNNGAGVFSAPESFDLGINLTYTVDWLIDDVDKDGLTDIILVNGPNSRFFKGTGGGNFAAPQIFALVTNAIYRLYDMDGDGNKDLVAAKGSNLNNNKSAQFIRWYRKVATSAVYEPMAVLYTTNVADFTIYNDFDIQDMDADGDPDILATSSYNDYFAWYENKGSLIFSEPHSLISESLSVPNTIGLADFNADGRIDIYTSSEVNQSVNWFKNLGQFPNRLTGTVRFDMDANGCTATDAGVPVVLVTTNDGNATSSVFTNPGGIFSINTAPGTYTTSITNVPQNYAVSPQSQQSVFAENSTTVTTADFCMVATTQITDLEISAFLLTNIRPGFPVRYKVLARNLGTTPVTGTVVVNFDNEKLNLNTVTPAATVQTANTLSFNLGTIVPFGNKEYYITFTAKSIPIISIGNSIILSAVATVAGDAEPANNAATITEIVVGSYDPNDIIVREGSEIVLQDADEYLHYLIRFQNTGNFYAEKVKVKNLIDSKLDWTTMQMESMSHTGRVEIKNGAEAIFSFDDIFLPASLVNETESHGYIAYKIKPKANVKLGDTFNNQAHIYFDFNPSIDTNIATTIIVNNTTGLLQISATTVVTNVACNGANNGTIDLIPSGGTPGYTYKWSDGITTQNRTGLTAGNYTVVITDANEYKSTVNVAVTEPALPLIATAVAQTNVSCNGNANGTATVIVTGGTGDYSYLWFPGGGTAATASGLSAGKYIVTVTDANGCKALQSFTITVTDAIIINSQPQNKTISTYANTQFVIDATSVNIYQWQVSKDGKNWADVVNGGVTPIYAGAATATLSLTNVPVDYNNYMYRVLLANGSECITKSNEAVLLVNNLPIAINDNFSGNALIVGAGGIAGDVTANDLFNNLPVVDTDIMISVINNDGIDGVTIDSYGNVIVPGTTATGIYTIAYSICDNHYLTNCSTAEAIVVVTELADSEKFNSSKLIIYPNPASTEVFVKIARHTYYSSISVKVYDFNGRLVRELSMNSEQQLIKVSGLETGIYIFNISTDKGQVSERVVIDKKS